MVMEGCPTCESVQKTDRSNIILQNKYAIATALDEWREGHCVVTLKRHVISISGIEPDEYTSVMDLLARVSKALEMKYGTRKTYVVSVGDSNKWQHFHFHLLPKHRSLPSYGVYAVQKLNEAEPLRHASPEQQNALADELRRLLTND
jgi:diadenosine tetraphosphate (Ap4A) HIT family hydrolase